jgi:hypothetical protein
MTSTTAWTSNNNELAVDMVKGALCQKIGWKKLEESSHFQYLKELITLTGVNNICDVGCGAGELGRVYNNYTYDGYDLPHIIENVSKIVNPQLNYHSFDATDNNYDYSIFTYYDMLVCNSFISELNNPIDILYKLLSNTSNYFIIHRQKFGNKTEIIQYKTYADLLTSQSIIGIEDFKQILKMSNTRVVKEYMFDGLVSLLIKKI